jgi:trehalose 6-phosphate synthase/phosphatase
MLLPSMLRKERPDLRIGFFLHTPFPSQEVFCCHPKRKELLEGLLGADLVGFHTFGYMRHFMKTVLRVLGVDSDFNSMVYKNHQTTINAHPIGINSEKFLDGLKSPECRSHIREFTEAYRGKKLVLSVERLDYTKGILRRLEAIRNYLTRTPDHDHIVFLFICVPSREDVDEYKTLMHKVMNKVSLINGKCSTIKNIPVHFIHQSVDFSKLCALYAMADVCVVTPPIDGMNLVAKEYVACQVKGRGVLILSEFAGAAQELSNALIVNPYNINQVSEAIETALSLSDHEREAMMAPMRVKVLRYDASQWAARFLRDLEKTAAVSVKSLPKNPLPLAHFPDYSKSNPLALFLDYDGTLRDLVKKPEDAVPDEELRQLLALLNHEPHITVFIISGRSREDMDAWFSDYGNLHLVAEHGFYVRLSGFSEWSVFNERANLSWMDQVGDMLMYHAGMTPGSRVEVKSASIVWHYRDSDPEYGQWKAHQFVSELSEIMANMPVTIHHGKKIVEVGSVLINKGGIVEYFMEKENYHRVICAGDDTTDESMFRLKHRKIIRIKIGPGETLAEYRFENPEAFRTFLKDALTQTVTVKGEMDL